MTKQIVLLTGALALSFAAGWVSYEFWEFYHPAPFGMAAAFIASIWYAIFNEYPGKKWMKKTLRNIFLFGIGAGLVCALFVYLGLSAEYNSYDGGLTRSSGELFQISLEVFCFFLVSTISSAIGYAISAGSRRLLYI